MPMEMNLVLCRLRYHLHMLIWMLKEYHVAACTAIPMVSPQVWTDLKCTVHLIFSSLVSDKYNEELLKQIWTWRSRWWGLGYLTVLKAQYLHNDRWTHLLVTSYHWFDTHVYEFIWHFHQLIRAYRILYGGPWHSAIIFNSSKKKYNLLLPAAVKP